MPGTIILAGAPFVMPEKVSSEGITPGHLVEVASGLLRKHATAAGNARPTFAIENLVPYPANVTTAPIDTPYATSDSVRWVEARPGDEIYAFLPASATAVVEGSDLVSNGDGTLKLYVPQATAESGSATYTIQTHAVIGKAAEAVDNSGGGTVVRLRVRAL